MRHSLEEAAIRSVNEADGFALGLEGPFESSGLPAFLRFAVLSGLGWLLDLSLLLLQVGLLGLAAAGANVVSSTVAALSVFLVSRLMIFRRQRHALGRRVVFYAAYTLCVIGVATLCLHGVVTLLRPIAAAQGWRPSATLLAGAAKIIVTPPQLLLNFVVARWTSERAMAR